ncbi:MAG: right-handed parallel beta-helix repeat-containing protein [Acidobacteriota bacterium]
MDWPLIGFANTTGSNPTFRAWNSNGSVGAWYDIPMTITYGTWYHLKIDVAGSTIRYYINGELKYTYTSELNAVTIKSLIVQAYNFGDAALPPTEYMLESYDVYWDNVGATSGIHNVTQDKYYATIPSAVTAAAAGNVIALDAGEYVLAGTVALNKSLTLQGAGSASSIIKVSGTAYAMTVTAADVTLQNLQIQKTDHANQNIILINANNFTLKNSIICGQYVLGDETETSRALETAGGLSGILIDANTFYALRQPAYINKPLSGEIRNNITYGTKGWVVDGGTPTFTGNSWGTGAQANMFDIAILASTPTTAYTDIVAMSNANNGAVIEDQRVTPRPLSVVYVNASADPAKGNGGKFYPYATLAPAVGRVAAGGTINVAAGTYAEAFIINKALTLLGANANIDPNTGTRVAESVIDESGIPSSGNQMLIQVTAAGKVVINGFKFIDNDITATSMRHLLYIPTTAGHEIKCNIFSRAASTTVGGDPRAITITPGATGTVTIDKNRFIGSSNADLFNNKGWRRGVWSDGGGAATVLTNNVFQYCRSAVNLDTYTSNSTVTGNTFNENGTALSFGILGAATYTISGNTFVNAAASTVINLSGSIDPAAIVDVSSNTFDGKLPSAMTSAELFALEYRMVHRFNTGKSGLVLVKQNNVYIVPSGAEKRGSIQEGINAASNNWAVNVAAGMYDEAVTVNKSLTLQGAGRDVTTIRGPKTAAQTVLLGASNSLFDGFTVTRAGNTVAEWPSNVNVSGIGFGQLLTGVEVRNCKVTETRNGIYLNNTQGHIHHNIITNNRTGLQLVNNVSNTLVEYNEITDNWTLGVVLYYLDPLPASTNVVVNNNTITGNWYGCVESKTASAIANPTSSYNFENNWFGTTTLNVVTTPAGEPGYAAQIPVAFGGSAVSPGSNEGKISGDLSGKIDYDPWVGMPKTITYANLNTPITFDQAKTTLTFTQLPNPTNATITIARSTTQPAGTPPPPANGGAAIPLFLDFDVTGLGNPFSVTITVDVSGIANFSAGTIVMFYNNSTGNWISLGSAGSYNAGAQTYTFTTDHFTTFSFVNPGNPVDLYITTDNLDPAKSVVYPHVGMGKALTAAQDGFNWTPVSPDWTYKLDSLVLYVVPAGSQAIIAANFKVKWDPAKASLGSIVHGTLFNGGAFNFSSAPGEVLIHASNTAAGLNVAPSAGKYLARIALLPNAIGAGTVSLDDIDFRYYDNAGDQQQSVIVTPHTASMKLYLGDFEKATPASAISGDGLINFTDLVPFATAYWKQQPATGYMSKFDIGPTNTNGSYFALPKPDGKIEFEDLVIFSIGYGKSATGALPKKSEAPIVFALGEREGTGSEVRIPVMLKGGVEDLRAFSLVLQSTAKFVRVEKAGELDTPDGFVIAKQDNGSICIDAAVIGADHAAISKEGVIAYVVLEGKGGIALSQVKARDSWNSDLKTDAVRTAVHAGVPDVFSVSQNYPNPFNPSTLISYQLPKQAMVEVSVYNAVGQKVAMLVNEVKEAGYYDVSWNAAGMASGVYFYHISAGEMNVTRKMVLMK